ncbi:MerR family DNA-binding transcriptional regulator [Mycobacterium haemophilum]|uniref:MerR family DNA-binding transcriptional regulator n=1 Tax=Mycobacterium haemophilum TaxID=29311 RepID=UPI0006D5BE9E|nr:MerR family DNA-binding transcriptional regulator [Mycobacterium haemophilum]
MRISEFSRQCGVPASTLRYYEDVGLLPATERTPAGYRLYDEHARQRLMFIEAAKRLKLSLSSIGELLAVWESDTCRSVKGQLRPALDDRIAEADSAIADLKLLRDQLVAARSRLDDLPDRDHRCDPDCTFLHDNKTLSLTSSLDGVRHRGGTETLTAPEHAQQIVADLTGGSCNGELS